MKAIWFSQARPTPEEVESADRIGYDIDPETVVTGIGLASLPIVSAATLDSVVGGLRRFVDKEQAGAVFGIFPVPLLSRFVGWGTVICYASWRVPDDALAVATSGAETRSIHYRWMRMGYFKS